MNRAREAWAPARLGPGFRWLLGSAWVSNLGDGLGIAAGPLLVASLTSDPMLVASAVLLQRLPWLLFGLHAGVLADRVDRRRLVVVVDTARACVLLGLTVAIALDAIGVAFVLVVMFVLGTAETFADTATNTLLPMLTPSDELGAGNARLVGAHMVGNQLLGPVLGAALFAAAMATPFVLQSACVAVGALLMSRIGTRAPSPRVETEPIRASITTALRWLWHDAPIRTLTLAIVAFNVTYGAAWSILVLYAKERLGLGDVGFGVLLAASAVGGVIGTCSYGWIERHVELSTAMRVGLVVETCTHLALALTTRPGVAALTLLVFGVHAAVWWTIASSVRQRAVPATLQGRVGAVYVMGVQGGLVVGAALGGVLTDVGDVRTPFWFGFAGSAVILAAIWRQLGHIAHAGRQPAA